MAPRISICSLFGINSCFAVFLFFLLISDATIKFFISHRSEERIVIMKNSTFTTRDLVMSAVLLGIGFVLHAVTPPLFFGIKPDFMLACMFIAIVINPNLKNTIVTGVVSGMIAALTTGFPGGQLPSIIDKFVSAIFIYILIKSVAAFINSPSKKSIFVCFASFLGTIVSGIVFLGSALMMFGLPAPFSVLFITVILPTSLANTFVAVIIFKVFGSVKAYA